MCQVARNICAYVPRVIRGCGIQGFKGPFAYRRPSLVPFSRSAAFILPIRWRYTSGPPLSLSNKQSANFTSFPHQPTPQPETASPAAERGSPRLPSISNTASAMDPNQRVVTSLEGTGLGFFVVSIVGGAISLVVVGLRTFVRLHARNFGVDDGLMLGGLVSNTLNSSDRSLQTWERLITFLTSCAR